MTDTPFNKKYMYTRWVLLRLGLVVFDILAVNAAYFLALLVRFYVNFEFHSVAAKYIAAFMKFSPYYTLCSLAVFTVMGLYKSLWKYAGLGDMNRIIGASAVTCAIHILGTVLFVKRMPVTYYILGAAFQFVLITISRFSYRVVVIERDKFSKRKKHDTVNVLVVGLDESSRTVIKQLDRDPDSMAKPVCVIDTSSSGVNARMSGVPVLGGIQKIPHAIRKYQVDRVLIADTIVPPEIRSEVKDICREQEVSVQDFSGYFQSAPSRIPLGTLLEYVEGPVRIGIGGKQTLYPTAEQAAGEISEKYIISSVSVQEDVLCIGLIQDVLRPNDIRADWVQTYQEETGEDISFF